MVNKEPQWTWKEPLKFGGRGSEEPEGWKLSPS